MKGKYLITTDGWFYAPNGSKYRAVWGEVEIMSDDVLGVKTNRLSTNWYARIGDDVNGVVVAGCQIHYAVRCEDKPNTGMAKDNTYGDGKFKEFERTCEIYIAEDGK